MSAIQLNLFLDSKLVFQAENVQAISLKLVEAGQVMILANHQALVGEIAPGEIVLQVANQPKRFTVGSGVFYFMNNQVKIITALPLKHVKV